MNLKINLEKRESFRKHDNSGYRYSNGQKKKEIEHVLRKQQWLIALTHVAKFGLPYLLIFGNKSIKNTVKILDCFRKVPKCVKNVLVFIIIFMYVKKY